MWMKGSHGGEKNTACWISATEAKSLVIKRFRLKYVIISSTSQGWCQVSFMDVNYLLHVWKLYVWHSNIGETMRVYRLLWGWCVCTAFDEDLTHPIWSEDRLCSVRGPRHHFKENTHACIHTRGMHVHAACIERYSSSGVSLLQTLTVFDHILIHLMKTGWGNT